MSNGIARGMSMNEIKKRTGDALSRLTKVEDTTNQLAIAFDAVMKQVGAKLANLNDTSEALANLVGKPAVLQEVVRIRAERQSAKENATRKSMQGLVENGISSVAEKIEKVESPKKILLALQEANLDGTLTTGYSPMFLDQFPQDNQDQLLGQGPGFSFKSHEDTTITILEIYVFDAEAERAYIQKIQNEQATQAAEADQAPAEAQG